MRLGSASRWFLIAVGVLGVACASVEAQTAASTAQSSNSTTTNARTENDPDLQRALELYRAGKFVDAMPLYEKLAADHPSDAAIKEEWAYSVIEYAATLQDPELRRKARAKARSIALQAQQLGDNSNLLQLVLAVPEDGSGPNYSDRKEIDEAMKAAEADFARGDLDKARDGYLRVTLLDPTNYEAALFTGDVYFKQHQNGSAGEWFARAIQIDPNRETAYRYWGDALSQMNKSAEAREKYIQAIVADPYNRRSSMGLNQWAQQAKLALNWVRLQDKSKATIGEKGATITLDPSVQTKDDPALAAWLIYSASRLRWQREKFKKEFPHEPTYRHTLREEADALHSMVEVLSTPEYAPKLDPSLAALVKIDRMGFIEPFALLNRVDPDIAKDYPAYRDSHRDIVYRYFDEYVVPKVPAQ